MMPLLQAHCSSEPSPWASWSHTRCERAQMCDFAARRHLLSLTVKRLPFPNTVSPRSESCIHAHLLLKGLPDNPTFNIFRVRVRECGSCVGATGSVPVALASSHCWLAFQVRLTFLLLRKHLKRRPTLCMSSWGCEHRAVGRNQL